MRNLKVQEGQNLGTGHRAALLCFILFKAQTKISFPCVFSGGLQEMSCKWQNICSKLFSSKPTRDGGSGRRALTWGRIIPGWHWCECRGKMFLCNDLVLLFLLPSSGWRPSASHDLIHTSPIERNLVSPAHVFCCFFLDLQVLFITCHFYPWKTHLFGQFGIKNPLKVIILKIIPKWQVCTVEHITLALCHQPKAQP